MSTARSDARRPEEPEPTLGHAMAEADDGSMRGGVFARAFAAMADRNFRLLYIGNLLQFGSQQMQLLIRSYLVFQLTGSFALLGTMALANAVPGVLLSPVGRSEEHTSELQSH